MPLTSSRPPCRKTLRRPWCRSSSIRTTPDGREPVKVPLPSRLHLVRATDSTETSIVQFSCQVVRTVYILKVGILGEAIEGRRPQGAAVRLAERQVRPLVAGRARHPAGAV